MSNILRRKRVEGKVGLGRSAIYEQMAAGTFPKCIKLGPRAVGWLETEIDDWLQSRIQASRAGK
jgi:prophage regulatory protein